MNENKKFVFVNLAIDGGYHDPHHGIAYLVPIIKKFGYEVSIINIMFTAMNKSSKKRE